MLGKREILIPANSVCFAVWTLQSDMHPEGVRWVGLSSKDRQLTVQQGLIGFRRSTVQVAWRPENAEFPDVISDFVVLVGGTAIATSQSN
jgi:hypothetical protein